MLTTLSILGLLVDWIPQSFRVSTDLSPTPLSWCRICISIPPLWTFLGSAISPHKFSFCFYVFKPLSLFPSIQCSSLTLHLSFIKGQPVLQGRLSAWLRLRCLIFPQSPLQHFLLNEDTSIYWSRSWLKTMIRLNQVSPCWAAPTPTFFARLVTHARWYRSRRVGLGQENEGQPSTNNSPPLSS